MKKLLLSLICAISLFFCACSSGPKRSMMVTTIYNSCNTSLEAANGCILNGDYNKAFSLLSVASNQALSIDNYDLLISVNLAYVSLCLSYNPPHTEEAWDYLETAQNLIPYSSNAEKNNARCTMSKTRILIANNSITTDYEKAIGEMKKVMKYFKDDPYNMAHCNSITGDLYRLCNNYKEAEKSYEEAAKIYTNERYLSEIGITWYKIAQNRSLSGNKKGALEALTNAIYYDRCAENSMGLGADYYIRGVILLKGTPTEEERNAALIALNHSAKIYNAVNLPDLAKKSLDLIESEGL